MSSNEKSTAKKQLQELKIQTLLLLGMVESIIAHIDEDIESIDSSDSGYASLDESDKHIPSPPMSIRSVGTFLPINLNDSIPKTYKRIDDPTIEAFRKSMLPDD